MFGLIVRLPKLPAISKSLIVPIVGILAGGYFHYRLEVAKVNIETARKATEVGYDTVAPAIKELQENMAKLASQVSVYQQVLDALLVARAGKSPEEALARAALLPAPSHGKPGGSRRVTVLESIPVPVLAPIEVEPERAKARMLLDRVKFAPIAQKRQVPKSLRDAVKAF